MEFGRRGGKEQEAHMRRDAKLGRTVEGGSVESQERKAFAVGGRKVIEEEVNALTMEGRQSQKEALAGERCSRAIPRPMLPAIPGAQQGVYAARGEAVTQEGEHAAAALSLCPEADPGVAWLARGLPRSEGLLGTAAGTRRARSRVFWGWERRGAVGFACSF
jgi:hypothetical protein